MDKEKAFTLDVNNKKSINEEKIEELLQDPQSEPPEKDREISEEEKKAALERKRKREMMIGKFYKLSKIKIKSFDDEELSPSSIGRRTGFEDGRASFSEKKRDEVEQDNQRKLEIWRNYFQHFSDKNEETTEKRGEVLLTAKKTEKKEKEKDPNFDSDEDEEEDKNEKPEIEGRKTDIFSLNLKNIFSTKSKKNRRRQEFYIISKSEKKKLIGSEILSLACSGDLEGVQKCENEGVDLNVLDSTNKRNTPLHIACANGHLNVVKELIKRPTCLRTFSSLETLNGKGLTPLQVAVQFGHFEIAKILLTNAGARHSMITDIFLEKNKVEKNIRNLISEEREKERNLFRLIMKFCASGKNFECKKDENNNSKNESTMEGMLNEIVKFVSTSFVNTSSKNPDNNNETILSVLFKNIPKIADKHEMDCLHSLILYFLHRNRSITVSKEDLLASKCCRRTIRLYDQKRKEQEVKRVAIELIETEATFLNDLRVAVDLFPTKPQISSKLEISNPNSGNTHNHPSGNNSGWEIAERVLKEVKMVCQGCLQMIKRMCESFPFEDRSLNRFFRAVRISAPLDHIAAYVKSHAVLVRILHSDSPDVKELKKAFASADKKVPLAKINMSSLLDKPRSRLIKYKEILNRMNKIIAGSFLIQKSKGNNPSDPTIDFEEEEEEEELYSDETEEEREKRLELENSFFEDLNELKSATEYFLERTKQIDETLKIAKNDVKLSLLDKLFKIKYNIKDLLRKADREYVFHETCANVTNFIKNEETVVSIYVFTDCLFLDLDPDEKLKKKDKKQKEAYAKFYPYDKFRICFIFDNETFRLMIYSNIFDISNGERMEAVDMTFKLKFEHLYHIYKESLSKQVTVLSQMKDIKVKKHHDLRREIIKHESLHTPSSSIDSTLTDDSDIID